MDARKRRRLEQAGWTVGSTADFLGLSAEEAALVEMKVALSEHVRTWRARAHMTQATLAKRLKSSQSRVAKLEAGDPSVSLDLLVRASLATGAKPREVARALSPQKRAAAG
jgi:DNA-binding XRE family transcriptional regulator